MREIAKQADDLIRQIRDQYPNLSDLSVAVLALVNALDRCEKNERSTDETLGQRRDLEVALEEARAETLRYRDQCWELKKEVLYYRNLGELYEERLSHLAHTGTRGEESKGKREQRPRPLDRMQQTLDESFQPADTNLLSAGQQKGLTSRQEEPVNPPEKSSKPKTRRKKATSGKDQPIE